MIKHKKKIIIGLLLILAAVCAFCIYIAVDRSSTIVEVICDGEVIKRIDLSKQTNFSFTIKNEYGTNTMDVHDGKISVTHSDCPDQRCVEMGELKSAFMPIVCLPHKLMIQYAEGTVEN